MRALIVAGLPRARCPRVIDSERGERLRGWGPRAVMVFVTLAAAPYLAACDAAAPPPPDGEFDWVKVCATNTIEPRRLPDDACQELGPTGRTRVDGAQWVGTQLPSSPLGDVEGPVQYDDDGFPYQDTETVPDTDEGGVNIVPIGSPLFVGGGPRWGPVPLSAAPRAAYGVSPAGGGFTRSGAGSGGFSSVGALVRSAGSGRPAVRTASPFVARGGLGVGSSGSTSGGS